MKSLPNFKSLLTLVLILSLVDGSAALVEWGVGEDINSIDINDTVVGFVFNNLSSTTKD